MAQQRKAEREQREVRRRADRWAQRAEMAVDRGRDGRREHRPEEVLGGGYLDAAARVQRVRAVLGGRSGGAGSRLMSRARAVRRNRAGLAAIAPQSPDEATRELERAVKELALQKAKTMMNQILSDREGGAQGVASTDGDFGRFPGVRRENPLAG